MSTKWISLRTAYSLRTTTSYSAQRNFEQPLIRTISNSEIQTIKSVEHVYEKLVELVAEGTFASEKLRLTEASIAHAAFSPRSASSDCLVEVV
jgi:hypothetical protein